MEDIIKKLNKIPNEYSIIKNKALNYLKYNSNIKDGIINIGNRKWAAPENYIIKIYPGINKRIIKKYENENRLIIPNIVKDFFININGLFAFGISLYGLSESMIKKGLLNRQNLECHDISIANKDWIKEYSIDRNLFHFGSRDYSYDEILGYFIDNNIIKCIRKNGEVVVEYNSFEDFLNKELNISEELENKFEPPKWDD